MVRQGLAVTPSPECLAFQCGPTGTWPEHDPARQSGEAGGKGAGAQDRVEDQLLTKRKTQTFRRQATGRETSGRGAAATLGTVLRAASLEVWGVLQHPRGSASGRRCKCQGPGVCVRRCLGNRRGSGCLSGGNRTSGRPRLHP